MSKGSEPSAALLEEIGELVASGVTCYVATRDASLAPEAMVGIGARIHPEQGRLTLYLPRAAADATRRNLEDNGAVAVTLTRPTDHKSVQLKGRALELRDSDEADRPLQAMHRAAMVEQLANVGVPRTLTRRLALWPSLAVEVAITHVYAQTPGPHAGEPLSKL